MVMYEHSLRIPQLFMGPGIKRGSKFDFLGTQVDLAPTWLGLAGLDTPEYMDGRSLVPLLVSEETAKAQGERLPGSVLHHLQRTSALTLVDPSDQTGKTMISQKQRTLSRTATFHQFYNEGPFGDRKGGHPLDDWSNTWLALYYQSKDGSEYKSIPYPGIDTLWKAFKRQVNRLPGFEFLGSRDPN